jgi:hypothetical protein
MVTSYHHNRRILATYLSYFCKNSKRTLFAEVAKNQNGFRYFPNPYPPPPENLEYKQLYGGELVQLKIPAKIGILGIACEQAFIQVA